MKKCPDRIQLRNPHNKFVMEPKYDTQDASSKKIQKSSARGDNTSNPLNEQTSSQQGVRPRGSPLHLPGILGGPIVQQSQQLSNSQHRLFAEWNTVQGLLAGLQPQQPLLRPPQLPSDPSTSLQLLRSLLGQSRTGTPVAATNLSDQNLLRILLSQSQNQTIGSSSSGESRSQLLSQSQWNGGRMGNAESSQYGSLRTTAPTNINNTTQPLSHITAKLAAEMQPFAGKLPAARSSRVPVSAESLLRNQSKNKPVGGSSEAKLLQNILPCRARGMPMEHNLKNAYFVITDDVEHGDNLICSFPQCRSMGVKFRYCKVCKVPIAQRNFYQKHAHVDVLGKGGGSKSDRGTKHNVTATNEKEDSEVRNIMDQVLEKAVSDSLKPEEGPAEETPPETIEVDRSEPSQHRAAANPQNLVGAGSHIDAIEVGLSKLPPYQNEHKIEIERRRAWTLLLLNRPHLDDDGGMSAWLMRVMAISDPTRPVDLSKLEQVYGEATTSEDALSAAAIAALMKSESTDEKKRAADFDSEKKRKSQKHQRLSADVAESSSSESGNKS